MEYCILYLGSIKPNYRLLQERFNTIFNSSRSCTAIGIKYRALCRRHSLLTCDEVEEFLEGKVECYDWHEERVDFLLPPDTRSVSVNLVHGIDALFEDFLIPALQLSLVSGYDNEAVWYRILGAGRRIVGDEKLLCDETDFKEMRKLVRQVDDPLVLVRAVTEVSRVSRLIPRLY